MDDYSVLAQRISVSVPEVRGCLILSRDGMVLGAYPDEDESLAKGAWLRFAALGEPEKSFVEFADATWAFVRRGPYAAFATADPGVRPGLMVDQLEQAMLAAEEGRSRRDTLRVPDASGAPSGKPRTSLHPGGGKEGKEGKDAKDGKGKDRDKGKPAEVGAEVAAEVGAEVGAEAAASRGAWSRGPQSIATGDDGATEPTQPPSEAPRAPVAEPPAAPAPAPATALKKEVQKLVGTGSGGAEEESEVDRVLLAKEFSGLLQMDSDDDEGSS
jgi:hypothetical protein